MNPIFMQQMAAVQNYNDEQKNVKENGSRKDIRRSSIHNK